jgi:hypothetical protein
MPEVVISNQSSDVGSRSASISPRNKRKTVVLSFREKSPLEQRLGKLIHREKLKMNMNRQMDMQRA